MYDYDFDNYDDSYYECDSGDDDDNDDNNEINNILSILVLQLQTVT